MMSEPLHTHSETHLYGDSFNEFAAGQMTEGDEVLVAAPTDDIATSIIDHLRDHIPGLAGQIETYCSNQSDLPFESDTQGHRRNQHTRPLTGTTTDGDKKY